MNQRGLAVIAFGLGVIAAPIGFSFFGTFVNPAVAQDQDLNQDLIVIQPADINWDPQEVYLALAKQKSQLLTPDELRRETEAFRRELVELLATRKLREVERQLERLIAEHPQSRAAERARVMLEGGRPVEDPQGDRDPGDVRRHRSEQPTYDFGGAEQTVPARRRSTPTLDR